MNYQTNKVTFALDNDYKIESGYFKVEDYKVSSGEDPHGNIYQGLKVDFNNSDLEFKIGRHKTKETAKWYNLKIGANQNTFDHGADELNFAMIGTLVIRLKGGVLVDKVEEFIFESVALAQGHTGGNNWWFGGKFCKNIGDHSVECIGKNKLNQDVKFVFQRGGNDLSTIKIKKVSLFDLATWISNIHDAKKLGELAMPGTHDAGMSILRNCSDGSGGLIGPFTKTQSLSISGQLLCGSRYFDIRVDYDHSSLITFHRTKGNGCSGQYLRDILDETVKFLSEHKSEFAIFKIRFRNYGDNHKESDIAELVSALLDSADYNDYLLKLTDSETGADGNIMEFPIHKLRGKLIIVCGYEDFCDVRKGRLRYFDYDASGINSAANLTVYDEYSDEQNFDKMKKIQLDRWKDYAIADRKYFFLLSWTMTPKTYVSWHSIETLANNANKELPSVLNEYIVNKNYSKPNVIYVDYLNQDVAQSIIVYNSI
ncbi:MAG TPA: hypothetical protein VFS71_19945 [Flavobacterium sp.]|uniref:hypothetical protein n=1 Tax=Flavobacterium sp. TaxID=239 RepID=UPI002DBE8042|nr:hypothetical protein [Flavobacterium sp.]HEU4791968.1 hypothetical protein [Flavobacterium sp.]